MAIGSFTIMLLTKYDDLPASRYFEKPATCAESCAGRLAYIHHPGQSQSPGIMFLPGFKSVMRSTKSRAIFNFCEEQSLEFTTLDYYGEGESRDSDTNSEETKKSIGQWKNDVIAVFDNIPSSQKQIIVGSSMGSWLMILLAKARFERMEGLLGIASAPDFTSLFMGDIAKSDKLANQMEMMGYCDLPTKYDSQGFYRIYQSFLDEAERHFVMTNPRGTLDLDIRLRLIHGMDDKDIDHTLSEILFSEFQTEDKKLHLIEGGDHRLSKPDEIEIIIETLKDLL